MPLHRFMKPLDALTQMFSPRRFARRAAFDGVANFSSVRLQSAAQLTRAAPYARADDGLALCAENLRTSPYGALPILVSDADSSVALADEALRGEDAASLESRRYARLFRRDVSASGTRGTLRVLGVLEEEDLSRALLDCVERAPFPNANGDASGEANFASLTARDAMRAVFSVPADASLPESLRLLEESGCAALPVENGGGYIGMISRADIVAALGGALRPPVIGGMATPLGVWLTTGTLNGGAPPVGLFLSGALMGAYFLIAHFAIYFALNFFNPPLAQLFLYPQEGGAGNLDYALNIGFAALETLGFLLLLRTSPLAGIHAAEHQTVWAIERGVPLRADLVAQMPRAHPRCGTNLVALGGLVQLLLGHLPRIAPETVLPALLLIYFVWRRFGTLLQEVFTTRRASAKQMESGLRAGREVLEKYQRYPHEMAGFAARAFNGGIILSALGLMSVMKAAEYVLERLFGM